MKEEKMKRKWLVLLLALTMGLTMGMGNAVAQVEVSAGTIGDALLFSLYDVRDVTNMRSDAWENFMVIENTSGNWTACHLRFRAYKKSIEVWDHVILLSPYDMFWLDILRDPATEQVKIWSDDYSTLRNSALIWGADARFEDYLSTDLMVACGFPDDPVETQHGEIEVIGLWSLSIPGGAAEDTHDLTEVVRDLWNGFQLDGVTPEPAGSINVNDVQYGLFYEFDPQDTTDPLTAAVTSACQQDPFVDPGFWGPGWELYADAEVLINSCEAPQQLCPGTPNTCYGIPRMALDCGNVLTGAFEMGDIGNGRYELQNFVVLRNFRTNEAGWTTGVSAFHRDQYGGGEIVYPPTVMSTDIAIAAYSQKYLPVTDDPDAYYLNESWTSTGGPGLRDGDDFFSVNAGAPVDAFNDIWSLDDVENALGKAAIWFHYFNDWDPGAMGIGYDTIVSMSFPTKHYHYFFFEPYWMSIAPNDGNWPYWDDGLNSGDPQTYLTRITILRAGIAELFDDFYGNGVIKADSKIWDDDENLYIPPGGSSTSPVTWK